jgi:hypothetical protein
MQTNPPFCCCQVHNLAHKLRLSHNLQSLKEVQRDTEVSYWVGVSHGLLGILMNTHGMSCALCIVTTLFNMRYYSNKVIEVMVVARLSK